MSVLVISNKIRVAAGISVHLYTNKLIKLKNMNCKFGIMNAAYRACKSHLKGNYLATFSVPNVVWQKWLKWHQSFFISKISIGNSSELKYILVKVSLFLSSSRCFSLVQITFLQWIRQIFWKQDNYIQSLILLMETTPFQFKINVLILFPLKYSKRKLI